MMLIEAPEDAVMRDPRVKARSAIKRFLMRYSIYSNLVKILGHSRVDAIFRYLDIGWA